jgi:hypothetical protein
MQSASITPDTRRISVLLRGEPALLRTWTDRWDAGRMLLCFGVIWLGAGLYGAAMGCWRAPLQALFVALKFPLIILLTTFGNALLNAMLAPLLGLNIPFRQSFLAILMSFTIASAILGSFSPITLFLVWNTPPLASDAALSWGPYSLIQLTHVGVIAFAGTIGNLRLGQLLRELSGNAAKAQRVLVAWLICNFFLGSQLSWILRPFIGSPTLPVQFLRANAFKGNFYESVFSSLGHLLGFK